jgi:DNA-binding transcriptional ArsR family regulator
MDVFLAISDSTRRGMLEMLLTGECSAGDFVSEFSEMTQSAVSQHLKVLRGVNLVRVRVDGSRRMYSLVPETLSEVDAWIARYRRSWPRKLDALAKHLDRKSK